MRPRSVRSLALIAAVAALAFAACSGPSTRTTFPPIGSTPQPAGDAAGATRGAVTAALAGAGLQAVDSVRAYRPPEGPLLAAAPRTLLEVPLAQDPDPAVIVIYALPSPDAALTAANDHAAFLRSNTGGINLPPGTQFVVRVVGSTVVFFHWLPASSPDPGTATIAQTLATLGDGVPVSP
jgi:hypothetical protein